MLLLLPHHFNLKCDCGCQDSKATDEQAKTEEGTCLIIFILHEIRLKASLESRSALHQHTPPHALKDSVACQSAHCRHHTTPNSKQVAPMRIPAFACLLAYVTSVSSLGIETPVRWALPG